MMEDPDNCGEKERDPVSIISEPLGASTHVRQKGH